MNKTSKGANGTGSIFKVTLPSGKNVWKVQVTLGRKSDGKPNRTTRTAQTKPEAQKLLRTLLKQKDDGVLAQVSSQTVATFAMHWAREVKPLSVRQTTASGYEDLIRRYVIPNIGNVKMTDLRPLHVQKLITSLKAQGLSANTINQTRRITHGFCEYAIRQGIIHFNPAHATDPVKRQSHDKTQVKSPWSLEEATTALRKGRLDDDVDCLLYIMLFTGFRPGEALGLRWEDIDDVTQRIHVTGTLREERRMTGDGTGVVRLRRNDPKTAHSRRTLPIQPELRDALERQRLRHSVWKTTASDEWQDSGYVLCTRIGTPMNPSNIRKKFYRFLETSGIRRIRLHDLRHVVAKSALEADTRIEDVSQALGHTRIDTTKQIYAGVVPRLNERFSQGVGDLFTTALRSETEKANQEEGIKRNG